MHNRDCISSPSLDSCAACQSSCRHPILRSRAFRAQGPNPPGLLRPLFGAPIIPSQTPQRRAFCKPREKSLFAGSDSYSTLGRKTEISSASTTILCTVHLFTARATVLPLRTVLALPGTWSPFLGAEMLPGMASMAAEIATEILGLILIGPRSI